MDDEDDFRLGVVQRGWVVEIDGDVAVFGLVVFVVQVEVDIFGFDGFAGHSAFH